MGLKESLSNAVINIAERVVDKSRGSRETFTLELIKESVKPSTYDSIYLDEWRKNGFKPNSEQINAVVIDKVRYGAAPIYRYNVFGNTINKNTKILKDEVLSESKVKVNDKIVHSYNLVNKNLSIHFANDTFKSIFETGFIYKRVGVYVEIENGNIILNVLKPYQYLRGSNEVYIMTFDAKGDSKIEHRKMVSKEIDGTTINKLHVDNRETQSDSLLFFEFEVDSDIFNYLEKILAFDLVDSNIDKEIELNKSKMFVDRDLNRGNPINKEVMNLIDVPTSADMTKNTRVGDYVHQIASGHSLDSIIGAKQDRAMDMVAVWGLSKKALGLESAPQDFATSLPYENDKTAKTVNNFRRSFEKQLSYTLSALSETPIVVDLGPYALESAESKIDINQKAIQSRQRSTLEAVAVNMGRSIDDKEVLLYSALAKFEAGIDLTFAEDEALRKSGLMSPSDFGG